MESVKITIYQKPTCTTCRQVYAILTKSGVDFDSVNYYFEPLSAQKIKDLLFKMRMSTKDLMRKNEPIYKELEIESKNFTDDHLIALMAKHPDLIQRPIVERGAKAILARPAEKIKDILPFRRNK